MSNSLDPDQARHIVRPDLGLNCLQKLSADDTNTQRVKHESKGRRQSLSGTDLAGPEVSGSESPSYVVSAMIVGFLKCLSRQSQKSLRNSINQELLFRSNTPTPKTIIQCPHKI